MFDTNVTKDLMDLPPKRLIMKNVPLKVAPYTIAQPVTAKIPMANSIPVQIVGANIKMLLF